MIGWLYRMIVGTFQSLPPHRHEWETVETALVQEKGQWGEDMGRWKRVSLRCKTCGDWKSIDLN